MQRRVLGEEHPDTLTSANNLASSLSDQGKHADAERIQREVLAMQRRVLGEEHPDTLTSANNLAATLVRRAKYTEAEQMLQSTLDASRRVLGSAHSRTLVTERWLEDVRSSMRAEQPTRTGGKVAARRNVRAAAPALSPTALRASAAEAELIAMLDL
jgi:predicted ABC-class ATPase